MGSRIHAGALVPVLLLTLLLAQSVRASEQVSRILDCMTDNMPQSSSVQNIEFRSQGASDDFLEDDVRVLTATVYLSRIPDKQRRVLAYFHEPFEVRGARILLLEKASGNETYLYAPVFGDVRRLTGRHISSSVNGTDFSYEDLEQLYGLASGGALTRLEDSDLNGEKVYVLKSVSDAESDSRYQSITVFVDKRTCVAMKMELYGKGDRLRKVYTVDPESLRQVNGLWIPHKMLMQDAHKRTETELSVHKVEVDVPLPEEMFEPDRLKEFEAR
jgi:hypothetical protein